MGIGIVLGLFLMCSKIVLGLPNGYWDCTWTFLDEF